MNNRTVRPATAADESSTVALWKACGLTVSYNDPATDFRRARAGAASDVLVAVDPSGRIAGSVMVGHDGHRGWVYYLSADPALRGQGIGRVLMQAAEGWLRERDIHKLQLMVRPTNTAVLSFYECLGYERSPVTVMQRWIDGR